MKPQASQARDENPFFVLGLPTTATTIEVERQKQKLLGMLELDLAQAARFDTPVGSRERTSELVRRAAEELHDPPRRLVWELWAASDGDREDPLRAAIAAHVELERQVGDRVPIDAAAVDAVGAAWDEALSAEETWDLIETRAAALEVGDPEAALDALGERALAELTDMIARARTFDLDGIESDLGNQASMAFLDRAIEGVELACQRVVSAPPSSAGDAWERWRALTRQHGDAIRGRGAYAARCAFDAVYSELSDYAVALFNEERYRLAREMFSWMRDRAAEVGDDEAYELQAENTRVTDAAWDGRSAVRQEDRGRGSASWLTGVLIMVAVSAGIRGCMRQGSSVDYQPNIHLDMDNIRLPSDRTFRGFEPTTWEPDPGASELTPLDPPPDPP